VEDVVRGFERDPQARANQQAVDEPAGEAKRPIDEQHAAGERLRRDSAAAHPTRAYRDRGRGHVKRSVAPVTPELTAGDLAMSV
jgi:hypothetical protein